MNDFNSGTAMKSFVALCSEQSTPLSHKISCLLKAGNFRGVLELKVSPGKYTCPQTLLIDLQLTSFFKKFEDLPFVSRKDRVEAAERLFTQSEHACFATNRRLDPLFSDSHHYGERIAAFIAVWRKKVKRILGPVPSWGEVRGRFGNGATFDNIGELTSVADKLSDHFTATKIPLELAHDWGQSAWSRYAARGLKPFGLDRELLDSSYADRSLITVRGNRFTTVTKQWDKDRGICIEPSVDVFYQLGIGHYIARCLKFAGCDKYTGQGYHKKLALIASLTRACATIDLSNASDTVCTALIELVLPPEWFELLSSIRCTHTFFKGNWVRLEKFSSMGNGFTFELETLVFYTLCLTVAEMEGVREDPYTPGLTISAYGDDIIVPSSIAASVISSLRFFGFEPNKAKTFIEGSFRESCGGDYLRGYDVRPFYLKKDLNENHRYIAAANGLLRTRLRAQATGLDEMFGYRSWKTILNGLPTAIRNHCFGPTILGDIVIHGVHWERRAKFRVRHSIRYLRVWRPVMNKGIPLHHFRPGVIYAAKLYGDALLNELQAEGLQNKLLTPFIPKINGSFVSGYKLGWVPFS